MMSLRPPRPLRFRSGWSHGSFVVVALLLVASTARVAADDATRPQRPFYERTIAGVPGDGVLNGAMGVAVARPESDGRIYVVDAGNARIQVFSPSFRPLGWFGHRGMGLGEFFQPSDIAVSLDGKFVYVVDQGQRRVQRFEPAPDCFGPTNPACFAADRVVAFGGHGIGDEFFQDPTGIAVDRNGSVYVADRAAHQIKKFSGDLRPTFLASFGSWGDGTGELMSPTDVAVAPDGKVWVADTENDRIQVFQADGKPDGHFKVDGLFHPTGIAIAADGSSLIRDYDDSYSQPRLWRLDPRRRPLLGGKPLSLDVLSQDAALAYPLLGVDFLADNSAVATNPFGPKHSLVQVPLGLLPSFVPLALRGHEPNQFDYPSDVAIDAQFVAVADLNNQRILILDPDNDYKTKNVIGGDLSAKVTLKTPRGMAVLPRDREAGGNLLLVADPGQHEVLVLSAKGKLEDTFGTGKSSGGADGLNMPYDVAVGPDGRIYIADAGNHRIAVRTLDGKSAGPSIGKPGLGKGELNYPVAVAVGPGGYIYTLERNSNRLQAFTPDGAVVDQWLSPDEHGENDDVAPGELWSPVALAGDKDHLYVLENGSAVGHVRVQVFDQPEPGQRLASHVYATFGDQTGAGSEDLWDPQGLGLAPDGRIMVADSGNNRVQVFNWVKGGQTLRPTLTAEPTRPAPSTQVPTEASAPTETQVPQATDLPPTAAPELPTATPVPPTDVPPTPIPATATDVPPTATQMPTPLPTEPATSTAEPTQVPPATRTPRATATVRPTLTPVRTTPAAGVNPIKRKAFVPVVLLRKRW